MRRAGREIGQFVNLDSLVDIVTNNVGILVIVAAFMALFALIDPRSASEAVVGTPLRPPPKKLLVPWSHPTHKNRVYAAVMKNRVRVFDLRKFYLELAERNPALRPQPVTVEQKGLKIRFFPVTNQVYCLEFTPHPAYGEDWLSAQRVDSAWQQALRSYGPEKYVYFFWVSGDSFELFRDLRGSLWDRNYEVGWKPARKDAPLEVCNGFEGSTAFSPQ